VTGGRRHLCFRWTPAAEGYAVPFAALLVVCRIDMLDIRRDGNVVRRTPLAVRRVSVYVPATKM
jgi:hypothetical protein